LKKIAPDLVIYSLAAKNDPELKQAQDMGVKTMSYPQALGELTKKHRTVAVAGAHGKSTVTAMIGLILAAAKFDPTVVVGTKVKSFGNTNFRAGKSDLLVIEACEYERAFWNYFPDIAVVTNIEMDHIECYKNEANLRAAFEKFAGNLKPGGKLLVYADDAGAKNLGELMEKRGIEVLNYSRIMPEAKVFFKNFCRFRESITLPTRWRRWLSGGFWEWTIKSFLNRWRNIAVHGGVLTAAGKKFLAKNYRGV